MIEKNSFLWQSISLGIVTFFCLIIFFTHLPIRDFFNSRGQNVKLEENNSDRNTTDNFNSGSSTKSVWNTIVVASSPLAFEGAFKLDRHCYGDGLSHKFLR